MKILTKRDMIKTVSDRFWEQYHFQDQKMCIGDTVKDTIGEVQRKLNGLDVETATEADVAAIIGNDGWCKLRCAECDKLVDIVVEFGSKYQEVKVCKDCLAKALADVVSREGK